MKTAPPPRTVVYESTVADSTRWDRFDPRADDIVISTPPKCGTTWTQQICALLIFGRPDHGQKPGAISPWLDARHFELEETLAMLAAQTHRRFIKTHTPRDGLPFYPQCAYLTVYRDPRDVYFSMRDHYLNQAHERFLYRVTDDIGAGFQDWVTRDYAPGDHDNFALGAVLHHYRTFRDHAYLPNVFLFHYSDMKRDLRGALARIAAALGIEHDDATLDRLADAASFESMKKNASQFVPGAGKGRWKDDRRFFNKGRLEQWREALSAADLTVYDARMRDLLPADEIAWLQNGEG